jgi:hypothetical protein
MRCSACGLGECRLHNLVSHRSRGCPLPRSRISAEIHRSRSSASPELPHLPEAHDRRDPIDSLQRCVAGAIFSSGEPVLGLRGTPYDCLRRPEFGNPDDTSTKSICATPEEYTPIFSDINADIDQRPGVIVTAFTGEQDRRTLDFSKPLCCAY